MRRHAKASSAGPSTRQASRLTAVIRRALATPASLHRGNGSGASSARLACSFFALLLIALVIGATAANAVAPVITAPTASNVQYTTAHFEGEVNPEDKETSYHFEYITDAQYLANEGNAEPPFSGASQAGAGSLPEGAGLTPVSTDPGGLSPQTVYHLRLVAENESGTESAVAASTFETKGPVVKPTIENLTISNVTTDSAHFSAEINPNGSDPAFETNWHFECEPSCGSGAIHSGPALSGGAQVVETDAAGLGANTTYTVRLYADNSAGLVKSTETFTTGGTAPIVKAFAAGPVQSDQVDLNAEVNPQGASTVYWFEWGKEDCSEPEAECQSVPAEHDASAGDGSSYVYVLRHLSELSPETTYHFRAVAKSAFGTTEGDDQEFTTAASPPASCPNDARRVEQHATFLPDCRAYEMVSPPDKNGGDVMPASKKTFAATDGNAIVFTSLVGFGDIKGSALDASYLARRTATPGTSGWSTHNINPVTPSSTFFTDATHNRATYPATFTPDLSSGVYRSAFPLTQGAPNVEPISNLYLRSGLLESSGESELLSDSVTSPPSFLVEAGAPALLTFFPIYSAGASTDLSHVFFVSAMGLTNDYPAFNFQSRLYEHSAAGVRLVGRIPSGAAKSCDDEAGPACVAAASSEPGLSASREQYTAGMFSADGSRAFFQSPAGSSGKVYMREDGVRTFKLNASEKAAPEKAQNARLWAASRDGSRAFFTTGEGLVDGDNNGNADVYMYDADKPEGERLSLISYSETGGSHYAETVIGASADGHYVYFIGSGDLVAGQPVGHGGADLYLWHDDNLSYVGEFVSSNEAGSYNSPRTLEYTFPQTFNSARITPDGRHLLVATIGDGFAGLGGFAGYEPGDDCGDAGCRVLYLYNADSGRIQCVSCNPAGAPAPQANGFAWTDANLKGLGASELSGHLSHVLSDDGRFVFFSTAESLLVDDTNGYFDAYEYDTLTGQLHLLSSGTSESDSFFLDASDDGRNAFIATRQRLSEWDVDGAYDLYDVRVDGGLPEPVQASAPCDGESCRPAASGAPALTTTASSTVTGGGNTKSHRCAKGLRAVRRGGGVHCVKRHRHKRHHRRADAGRRAGR